MDSILCKHSELKQILDKFILQLGLLEFYENY